jgi:hypothetical protein
MILDYFFATDIEHKDAPLWHHLAGLQFTASGYGRRIPTRTMVKLPGTKRWRRVYCCIYSNVGTCYITKGKDWIIINNNLAS